MLRLADSTLLRLNKLFSTPAGIDASLGTAYYTLRFVHAQLLKSLEKQYERLAEDLVKTATDITLPGETTIASISAPQTQLAEACKTVKTTAGAISDFRAFTRLWGLLGVYSWARGTYFDPPRDSVIKALVWSQIIACFWFQSLENAAYLVSKGILRGKEWSKREAKWYRWSSGFWLVHIVLETARLLRTKQIEVQEKEAKENTTARRQADRQWQLDFYRNASFAPLAYHWSVADGKSPLTETWVGLFGMFPGILRLQGLWAATA